MNITNVKALYLSGTGTTEKVVRSFSKALGIQLSVPVKFISVNNPELRKEQILCKPTELLVLGCPTYAGRVPNLILPYFQQNIKGQGGPAVPICLYGNRNVDDALMELSLTLEKNDFIPIGGAAVVGQHVFAPALGTGRPDNNDLRMMDTLAVELAKKLKEQDKLSPVVVEGQNPPRPHYSPRDRHGYPINILKVRPKTHKSKCKKCGICITGCPTGAIAPDPSMVPGPCMKCGACLKNCPNEAKYYDDPGFLFHKDELEAKYTEPQKTKIFY